MTPGTRPIVRVTHRFNAPAERVFDSWLDPKTAGRWLFATPTGRMVRVEIDARIGGQFIIVERRGAEDIEHRGEYLDIDRPRRLIFTFGVPKYSRDMTRVCVGILPRETGCELTLTHEGVLPEFTDRTNAGWMEILAKLAADLA